MSWLNRVRNSLPFIPKRSTDENLWTKCPGCSEMLFTREYEENLQVCPNCNHHGRIGADERLRQLMDEGFELLPEPQVREDPLKFRDQKPYPARLKAARAKNPPSRPKGDAFAVASGDDRGAGGGGRRAGFRLHGRQHGAGGRRRLHRRGRTRTPAGLRLHRRDGGGRRADAGGYPQPDADA